MLENATVTMPYVELKELVEQNKEYEEKLGKMEDIKNMEMEEFESHPFKKGLDTVFDLLEKASKYSKADEKQYFIHKGMIEYCKTFEIPEHELMEDVPIGKEPKEEQFVGIVR